MDDIKPGDVVVCVDDGPSNPDTLPLDFIHRGQVFRVNRVCLFEGAPVLDLGFTAPDTTSGYYCVWRFRKIEAPKTELCERIRKCRPIRTREDA